MSLHGTLERAKLGLMDSSKIQLAVCDVDKIEKLERFRKRCIPTIVFCNVSLEVMNCDCVFTKWLCLEWKSR